MLQNKDMIWVTNETWSFTLKNDLIYIENNVTQKVLESSDDGTVSQEDYEDGNARQLWKRGEPDVEGYYTLENSGVPHLLTAFSKTINNISESGLEVKGKMDTTN